MIYTALASITLSLVMVLSGIDMFGQDHWWTGLAAGVVIALAWHINHRVGALLGVIGVTLLLFGVTGSASLLSQADRAMFNGMAAGFMLGLVIGAVLRWPQFKPHLVVLARVERVHWLSKLLDESIHVSGQIDDVQANHHQGKTVMKIFGKGLVRRLIGSAIFAALFFAVLALCVWFKSLWGEPLGLDGLLLAVALMYLLYRAMPFIGQFMRDYS